ncbi:MAG: hypothetical protein NDI60_00665 [Elusimicrobiales bacterium]|nr:hypothetical protein [Elusimicrobiales bacterium]
MSINAVCACGAAYNLKDEYAGTTLACAKCGAPVAVPQPPPPPPVRPQAGDPAFARDLFLLNQQHLAIREKYTVADEEGAPVLYVERPRYILLNVLAILGGLFAGGVNLIIFGVLYGLVQMSALDQVLLTLLALWQKLGSLFVVVVVSMALSKKRHVTVYRDESRGEVLLSILQEYKVQLLGSSFTVTDPQGVPVGRLVKKYLHNIFRKRWYCFAPGGELLFTAREDSVILSILRRFLGSFFGLLRTNFLICGPLGNVLGEFNRRMTLLDRYVLDMTQDPTRQIDRRLALAVGVMLDTGEKR